MFSIDDVEHEARSDCTTCWEGWPRPCACGGRIHAQLTRSSDGRTGDFVIVTACERCGEPGRPARDP